MGVLQFFFSAAPGAEAPFIAGLEHDVDVVVCHVRLEVVKEVYAVRANTPLGVCPACLRAPGASGRGRGDVGDDEEFFHGVYGVIMAINQRAHILQGGI